MLSHRMHAPSRCVYAVLGIGHSSPITLLKNRVVKDFGFIRLEPTSRQARLREQFLGHWKNGVSELRRESCRQTRRASPPAIARRMIHTVPPRVPP